MNDSPPNVVQWLLGGFSAVMATIAGGSVLYNKKKLDEIPEKYLMKVDFNEAKKEILMAINRIHDRMDDCQDRRVKER